MNQLVPITAHVPGVVAAGERAQTRFWEFFVSNIRNPHTRRAYGRSIALILPMARHWSTLKKWRRMRARAPPSSMTGRKSGSRRTRWRGSGFSLGIL
jgi:hypothetical protein